MSLITMRLNTWACTFPELGWLALSRQVFIARISGVRVVIIFSFVDLGLSTHMLATA
jgi:hypothetical protein